MTTSLDPRNETLQLVSQVETRHRQPDLCTIYEPDSEGMSKMATWITAKGDAFVDTESYR